MTERIFVTPIDGIKVRHTGVLDLDDFMFWLKRWLDFNGYKQDEDFYEEKSTQKGKIAIFRWTAKKTKDQYFSYIIEIYFNFIGIVDVEVPIENRKIKMQKGEFEIKLVACLNKGEEAPTFFRSIYEKFLKKETIEFHLSEVYSRVYSLQEEIKSKFNQYV